jgi:enoyl-CoA hydratase
MAGSRTTEASSVISELPTFNDILLDRAAPHVLRITLNRPAKRNAQSWDMIYEINRAFEYFAHDEHSKVAILAAAGPDFSSGHDLSGVGKREVADYKPVGLWGQLTAPGYEGPYSREREIYFDITERWRSVPKPTIAQVHGRCIAGGLMLAWVCDLIIASDDALFVDNTVAMGVCGVEIFAHPFEVGFRKAKEWLFTSDVLTAQEAKTRGMVNQVVERSKLESFTLEIAKKIASKPMLALKLAKEAINHAEDLAGRRNGLMYGFALHQLCHAHNIALGGFPITMDALPKKVQEAAQAWAEKRDFGGPNPDRGAE